MEDPSRAHGARAGHMPTGCTLHLARRRLGVVLVGGDGARNSRHRGANFSWGEGFLALANANRPAPDDEMLQGVQVG